MALRFIPSQSPVHTDASDCVVVGAFSDKTFSPSVTALDAAAGGRLKALAERGDISGKTGQTLLLQDVPGVASARVLVIGTGAAAGAAVQAPDPPPAPGPAPPAMAAGWLRSTGRP